jgi:uncharacterized protein
MADAKDQHEPSMEEILASIRRIIAEDGETTEGDKGDAKVASAPDKTEEDDVLELTEVVEEGEPVANTSEATAAAAHTDEPPFTLETEPDPPRVEPPAATAGDERLVSAESASASVAALSQLVNRPRDRSEMPLGQADRTLEDVVRELLRPLLKTWLDERLPQLVERLVQEEIVRLVREAQGR